MSKYLIYKPDGGTLSLDAEKAIKSGQQTVFYGKDGQEIIAQIPNSWAFMKVGVE